MAVEFDASSSKDFDDSSDVSWAHTITDLGIGRALLVLVSVSGGGGYSVSFAGESLTSLEDANGGEIELFYLLDPPTGAGTIAVSGTLNTDGAGAAVSYTGIDTESAGTAFGTIEETSGASPLSDTVASATNQRVLSAIGVEKGSSGALSEPTASETDQEERVSESNGDGSRWAAAAFSDSPGATSTTVGWDGGWGGTGYMMSFGLKPADPVRERSTRYEVDTYRNRQMGRSVVIEGQTGRMVPLEQIQKNEWIRVNGPFFPTTRRYANLVEDPAVGYIESISISGVNDANPRARITVRKESQFDFLLRRLTGRAI